MCTTKRAPNKQKEREIVLGRKMVEKRVKLWTNNHKNHITNDEINAEWTEAKKVKYSSNYKLDEVMQKGGFLSAFASLWTAAVVASDSISSSI